MIDGDVTNHSWNQIIKNIPITNNPALGGAISRGQHQDK